MESESIVRLKEHIKPNIQKGDFVIVGKMLGISQDNARMRFQRNKEVAVLAMKELIETRENLIHKYRSKLSQV